MSAAARPASHRGVDGEARPFSPSGRRALSLLEARSLVWTQEGPRSQEVPKLVCVYPSAFDGVLVCTPPAASRGRWCPGLTRPGGVGLARYPLDGLRHDLPPCHIPIFRLDDADHEHLFDPPQASASCSCRRQTPRAGPRPISSIVRGGARIRGFLVDNTICLHCL